LDSLLRFTPCQSGLKGVEGIEEPVGRWQRDLVNEILRRRNSTPVEGGDPARDYVDEAVQLRSGSARLTYPYRSAVSPSKSFAPRRFRARGRGRPNVGGVPYRRRRDALPLTPRGKDLIAGAFRKHSGQMKKVFSELSLEELRGLEVALKKVGTRAAALMEES